MWKKVLTSFFIGATLFTMSPVVQAADMDKVTIEQNILIENHEQDLFIARRSGGKRTLTTNIPGYEVINPDRDSFSTETKVALINGKAPAKTPITIKLYGTTGGNAGNTFNLNKLPSSKDYIEVSSDTIYSGNLGFFQKQQDLVMGINKIVIDFGAKDVKPIEIIVYVYEKAPSLTDIMTRN